jgi:hydrogenase maturation protein HypF
LSILFANGIEWDAKLPCAMAGSESEKQLLRQQLDREINCVLTSSMGRLFDAVASLIGVRHAVNYEAQAAMEMETLAQTAIENVDPNAYSFEYARTSLTQTKLARLMNAICEDVLRGVDQEVIAARFHHAVSKMIADVCVSARNETQVNIVGLTGGVFQNVLLLRLTQQELIKHGFQLLTHSVVPPNDGGIALGQALVARNWVQGRRGI